MLLGFKPIPLPFLKNSFRHFKNLDELKQVSSGNAPQDGVIFTVENRPL